MVCIRAVPRSARPRREIGERRRPTHPRAFSAQLCLMHATLTDSPGWFFRASAPKSRRWSSTCATKFMT